MIENRKSHFLGTLLSALLIAGQSWATPTTGEDNLSQQHRKFLSAWYPAVYSDVSWSDEFEAQGRLKKRILNTGIDVHAYFLDVPRHNRNIGPTEFRVAPSEPQSLWTDYATEPNLSRLLSDRDGSDLSAAVDNLETFVAVLRSGDLDGDESDNYAGLIRRRDVWNVVSQLLSWIQTTDYRLPDKLDKSETVNRLLEITRRCSPTDSERDTWLELSVRERVEQAFGKGPAELKDVLGDIANAYQVGTARQKMFEHNLVFSGSSLTYVFIGAPTVAASYFEKMYTTVSNVYSENKLLKDYQQEIGEFPPNCSTVLIRVAALPLVDPATKQITIIESPLVEEVLVRRYVTGNYQDDVKLELSDFKDIKYWQFKWGRGLAMQARAGYLNSIPEDAPVFYGYLTDAPDLMRSGEFVVTMRGNCTDCHMNSGFGWRTTRSLVIPYERRSERKRNRSVRFDKISMNHWKLFYD